MKPALFIVIFLLLSNSSQAATLLNTKITLLMIDKQYPNKVFIKASRPHNYKSPRCISSSWSFVLKINNPFDKRMYEALLAAKINDREVNLTGSKTCKVHEGVEDLRRIEIM